MFDLRTPWVFNRRRCLLVGLLLSPLVLWLGLLLLVPTEWARRRLIEQIADSTGQEVKIGGVSLSFLGRLQVRDLSIARPATPGDPWLTANSASLDVNLLQMIGGCCQPAEVDVAGLHLRVQRLEDGTLDLADLLQKRPHKGSLAAAEAEACPGVNLAIRNASLTFIDVQAGCQYEVTRVVGRATWSAKSATVEDLSGRLNGGTFEFAARCDRTQSELAFEAETRMRAVSLSEGMNGLSYLMPVVAGLDDSVDGRMHLRLAIRGRGLRAESIRKSLEGHGVVAIDPVNLDGSRFLREVETVYRLPGVERLGSVHSNFMIADGKILSDDVVVKVAGIPVVLSGWTDFDGNLDYVARTELTQKHLPQVAKSFLAELEMKVEDLAGLRIAGTLNDIKVTVERNGVATKADRLLKDKKRLGDIRDRLIDRVLR